MPTAHAVNFAESDLLLYLERFSNDELDSFDFGVIGFDSQGVVRRYNAYESRAAGLSAAKVLGQPLFTVVAPCMNNYMVAQRFEEAQETSANLDMIVDYVLTLRMKPVKVKLRLLASPNSVSRYVLVQRLA